MLFFRRLSFAFNVLRHANHKISDRIADAGSSGRPNSGANYRTAYDTSSTPGNSSNKRPPPVRQVFRSILRQPRRRHHRLRPQLGNQPPPQSCLRHRFRLDPSRPELPNSQESCKQKDTCFHQFLPQSDPDLATAGSTDRKTGTRSNKAPW